MITDFYKWVENKIQNIPSTAEDFVKQLKSNIGPQANKLKNLIRLQSFDREGVIEVKIQSNGEKQEFKFSQADLAAQWISKQVPQLQQQQQQQQMSHPSTAEEFAKKLMSNMGQWESKAREIIKIRAFDEERAVEIEAGSRRRQKFSFDQVDKATQWVFQLIRHFGDGSMGGINANDYTY